MRRFWSKVRIGGPDDCWEWQASCFGEGYGSFWYKRKNVGTHRVAYELGVGPIPEGQQILHTCDNRKCCNPAHLFPGTQLDNIRDMDSKKRRVGNVKLTNSQIIEIRQKYIPRVCTQQQLAEEYGVVQSHIGRIVRNEQREEEKTYET
jgi:hypothetical protein